MVTIRDIYNSNKSLKHGGSGLVAVVIGGTAGIGRAFLKHLAANTDSPKIYILGRNQTGLDTLVKELQSVNSTATYIPVLTDDLALIRNVDAATDKIKTLLAADNATPKIDLLFMSAGWVSFGSRMPTPVEDIDAATGIRYYSRMRFLYLLLPNLLQAPSPRVLDVLAGGQEGAIYPDDLSLRDPKNYSFGSTANASATYTTLFLEHLHSSLLPDDAAREKISFVHLFPGLTSGTNLFNNPSVRASASPLLFKLLTWVVLPLISPLLFTPVDQVGARALFASTNGRFRSVPSLAASSGGDDSTKTDIAKGSDGKIGSGVYTLNEKTEPVQNAKVLHPLRQKGWPEKIYEHTVAEWERALAAYGD